MTTGPNRRGACRSKAPPRDGGPPAAASTGAVAGVGRGTHGNGQFAGRHFEVEEAEMPVGFRVYATVVRPEPTLLERFADLRTPDISDAMNRAGTMDNGIQPAYRPIGRVIGPAVTVSVPTGAFNVIKAG